MTTLSTLPFYPPFGSRSSTSTSTQRKRPWQNSQSRVTSSTAVVTVLVVFIVQMTASFILSYQLFERYHFGNQQQGQQYTDQPFQPGEATFADSHTSQLPPSQLINTLSAITEQEKAQLRSHFPPSVWARSISPDTVADSKYANTNVVNLVRQKLSHDEELQALMLCGKFLYSTLSRAAVAHDLGQSVFVSTGDIPYMWTRDSAVQMGIYTGRLGSSDASGTSLSWLRLLVEGAIRRQAFYILQDPYANAYYDKWKSTSSLSVTDRSLGRGGWVATRNYELDSGAYFISQLWDFYTAPNVYHTDALIGETMIFEAVQLLVQTWQVEQHHESKSPYRYIELPRNGLGKPSNYTGMTWTGFRPSDDKCSYNYHIPSNIYAAAALERVLELNKRIWQSQSLHKRASKLLADIEDGINKYGTVTAENGERVYAYEVDGLGNMQNAYDDANVPSLLSIPLLGWTKYDRSVYANTRRRVTNNVTNPYYFDGDALRGQGSTHTWRSFVWPMSFTVEALTTEGSDEEKADALVFQLRQSLAAACLEATHESVDSRTGCSVSNSRFSRSWFEWSNVMFVTLVETAFGGQCDAVSQDYTRQESLGDVKKEMQKQEQMKGGQRGGRPVDDKTELATPLYYQGIEAKVRYSD